MSKSLNRLQVCCAVIAMPFPLSSDKSAVFQAPVEDVASQMEAAVMGVLNTFYASHASLSPDEASKIVAEGCKRITRAVEGFQRSLASDWEVQKKKKLAARQNTKRAPVQSVEAGLKSLTAMQSKARGEVRKRKLGFDPDDFLVHNVSNWDAFKGSVAVMIKMFSVVLLLSLLVYVSVRIVEGNLEAINQKMNIGSSEQRFNKNSTNITSLNTTDEIMMDRDVSDTLANARNEVAIKTTMVGAIISAMMGWFAVAAFFGVRRVRAYILIACPSTLMLAFVFLFYNFGGTYMDNVVACVLGIVSAGVAAMFMCLAAVNEVESDEGSNIQFIAGKRALQLLNRGTFKGRSSFKSKLKLSILGALPTLFVFSVALLYTTMIFALYRASSSLVAKVAVTLLAFLIKVVGNKLLLKLVERQPGFMVDFILFSYEFVTATLLRVLQLSIPNLEAAMLLSLFGAVAEVCVRIFFFSRFMQAGLAQNHADMTAAEQLKYARWGKMRVTDGTNDMIVEYVSSFTAAMFTIYLTRTGAFTFASGDEVVEQSVVWTLVLYQLVPEIFLDFYVTFMEIQGGLKKVHEVLWSWSVGGDPGSKFRVFRLGDLVKGLILKIIITVAIVFFVLAAVIK